MPSKLDIKYGLDPEKPYTFSMLLNVTLPFSPDLGSYAEADAMLRADTASNGSGFNFHANDVANALRAALGIMQGKEVEVYKCTLSTTPDGDYDPDNFTPVADVPVAGYWDGQNMAIQKAVPNAVAGVKGISTVTGAPRIYAVGLLTHDTLDVPSLDPLTGSVGSVTQAIRTFWGLLHWGGALCVSAQGTERIMTPVQVRKLAYKGVRRA